MKLVVEVLATFVLIYWPAALMAVRSVLDDGASTRARFTNTVVPVIIFLPAFFGLLFYSRNWTFLWFSAPAFLTASLVLPLVAGALLGFPRVLFDTRHRDAMAGYVVRPRAVYYEGVQLADADPSTFETLSARIGRDQRHVFRGAEILIGATPSSFEILDSDYQRDARRVYYFEKVIAGAEPGTFERIDCNGEPTRFWRDAYSVYFLGKRIGLADATTFTPLTQRYARDEQRVFHEGEVVYDADAASFETLDRRDGKPMSHDARDQHRCYLRGNAL